MRRALIYTHRWLGIGGCLLFITWFASGIVMMYARMPELTQDERLTRLEPVSLSAARISPAAAARAIGGVPSTIRLAMFEGRPVYRLAAGRQAVTVFADSGETLDGLSRERVVAIARAFTATPGSTPRYDALLEAPDQWTLTGVPRGAFPLHRVAVDDPARTRIYVSDTTGEPVMRTTARARRWGYAGAVLHWLYFAPFRRQATLWAQSVIWLSIAGCLMAATGLIWGVWRLSPSARYRLKREHAHSPYAGMMHWHHYAGLLFGVTTCTWIFSGLLSMDPWDWHPGTMPTRPQREGVTGGPLRLDAITVRRLQAAANAVATLAPREIEIVQFRGEPYLIAHSPSRAQPDMASGFRRRGALRLTAVASAVAVSRMTPAIVPALDPERGPFARFADDELLGAARAAMPQTAIADATWLHAYDAYYHDRHGSLSLPVLRVRYGDPQETWLYLDPRRGAVVRKEERWSRVNRWLYHGLHSFDFPFLYDRRPLWDVVVIVLSVGGIVSSVTAVTQALRRLRRHARRLGAH